MFISFVGFQAVFGLASCVSLGPPQFESEWVILTAQSASSDLLIPHGLGVVPTIVEVLVRSLDEPNKGFIFKAIGNGERDDDSPDSYGAVVYMYNEVIVRVMAPYGMNNNQGGGSIYTGEAPYWHGVNSQLSMSAEIKVRCWSDLLLPVPCFNVSGVQMVAGSSNVADTYREFSHGLAQYPMIVKVRTHIIDGVDSGWYADAQGASMMNYHTMGSWFVTGGLKYAFNNETIRVWTSSYPYPEGVMFARNDGWGNNRNYYGVSTTGYIEVLAWCGLYPSFDYRKPIGPGVFGEELEVSFTSHSPSITDYFVSTAIEATNGPNKGYRFPGIGGAMPNTYNLGQPCAYGGLNFAYNRTSVRIWRPDSSTGAAICIPQNMGHGTNSQASKEGILIIRVFLIAQFGVAPLYQPARLVFSHFTLLGMNMTFNASPMDVSNSTTLRMCNSDCQQHESCVTYVFNNAYCKMYNFTDRHLFLPELDSQVWGLKARTVNVKDYPLRP